MKADPWWAQSGAWRASIENRQPAGVVHWLALLLGGEATIPLVGDPSGAHDAPAPRWRRERQRIFGSLEAALAWALPQLSAKPPGTRRLTLNQRPRGDSWHAESPQAIRQLARALAGWNGIPPSAEDDGDEALAPPTFTPHQRAVIDHHGAPAVVVAVAGAGKTTTLIARVKALVARGRVSPHQLLLLSFSRAAVATLRARLRDDPACVRVEVATFHALAYRLRETGARLAGQRLPTSPPPELLVARVRDHALRAALEHDPDLARAWRRVDLEAFAAYRGRCLAELAWPASPRPLPKVLRNELRAPPDDPDHADHAALLLDFERHRQKLGWCDHDQSLVDALIALLTQPALLAWARDRHQAAVVDEAQDLSPVQLLTLSTLFAGRHEVMLVGDDDQSIYAFRGATPGSLRRYAQHHRARVLTLPDAFRCRAEPLAAAATLMQAAGERWALQPRSVRGPGGMLSLCAAADPTAEADALIERAHAHAAGGLGWRHQVVLLRRFAQAPEIEQAAWRRDVPVRLEGATSVTRHPSVLAAWAGIALALGAAGALPASRERAWRRWLQQAHSLPRGVAWASARELAADPAPGAAAWGRHRDATIGAHLQKIADLAADPAAALLSAGHPEAQWPLPPPPALQASAERLRRHPGDTREALTRARQAWRAPATTDALLLTSVHRAKGLEWPVVHVPGMNAGSFPRSDDPEERRLAYVAWTRARDTLHLYHHQQAPPSPFLRDGEVREIAALARDHAFWRADPEAPPTLAALWFRREARERFGAEPR